MPKDFQYEQYLKEMRRQKVTKDVLDYLDVPDRVRRKFEADPLEQMDIILSEMTYEERLQLKEKHPDEFEEYMHRNDPKPEPVTEVTEAFVHEIDNLDTLDRMQRLSELKTEDPAKYRGYFKKHNEIRTAEEMERKANNRKWEGIVDEKGTLYPYNKDLPIVTNDGVHVPRNQWTKYQMERYKRNGNKWGGSSTPCLDPENSNKFYG